MHSTPSSGISASLASGPDTRSLPRQRALLSWLFGARTAIAVGTLLIAALQWTNTPDVSFILSIAVLLTLGAEMKCLNTHFRGTGDYCAGSGQEPWERAGAVGPTP